MYDAQLGRLVLSSNALRLRLDKCFLFLSFSPSEPAMFQTISSLIPSALQLSNDKSSPSPVDTPQHEETTPYTEPPTIMQRAAEEQAARRQKERRNEVNHVSMLCICVSLRTPQARPQDLVPVRPVSVDFRSQACMTLRWACHAVLVGVDAALSSANMGAARHRLLLGLRLSCRWQRGACY